MNLNTVLIYFILTLYETARYINYVLIRDEIDIDLLYVYMILYSHASSSVLPSKRRGGGDIISTKKNEKIPAGWAIAFAPSTCVHPWC